MHGPDIKKTLLRHEGDCTNPSKAALTHEVLMLNSPGSGAGAPLPMESTAKILVLWLIFGGLNNIT